MADPKEGGRRSNAGVHRLLSRGAMVVGALVIGVGPITTGMMLPASAATPTVVVSGYDTSRVDSDWGLFSSCLDTTNGYVTDPANFGPSGVANVNLDLSGGGMPTATSSSLAGVDVFFTGWVTTASYTDAEKAALLDYVEQGGALIGTTDGTDHDMSSIFGVTLANSPGDTETGTITDASSPLADGPFGTVTTFTEEGDIGHYTDVGPGQTVGTNPEGPAIVVIPPGALAAGSGPVVLVSDVDVFSDCSSGPGAVVNEVLIKNIFAYVATAVAVPPTTTTTSSPTTTTPVAPAPAVAATPAFTG